MDKPEDKPAKPPAAPFRSFDGDYRWDDVSLLAYKEEGSAPFKSITRQTLFQDSELRCELRYFEVAPGGHTTLERHEHVHSVMVIRGRGRCLVGDAAWDLEANDLISVPPMTWHQFRAADDAPLGFLCMVPSERDRPQLPSDEERQRISKPFAR